MTLRADVSVRQTRVSKRGDLHLSRCRLSASQRAFSYRAASTWNGLPPAGAASDAQTAGAFKQHVHRCIVKSVIVFKDSVLYAPLPHFIHFIAFLLCFVPDVSAEKPFVLTDVLNK